MSFDGASVHHMTSRSLIRDAGQRMKGLAQGELAGAHHQFTDLIETLGSGDISALDALASLRTNQAELVREVALGCLLEFRETFEGR